MNRKVFFKRLGLVAGGCLCLPFIASSAPKKALPVIIDSKWDYLEAEEAFRHYDKYPYTYSKCFSPETLEGLYLRYGNQKSSI